MRLARRVEGVFEEDGGLDVGVRDGAGSRRQGLVHDTCGRQRTRREVEAEARRLGDLPVLAERAVERTADRGDRVGEGSRSDMEERLLLDRVDADRRSPPVDGGDQRPIPVLTNPADPARGPGARGNASRRRCSGRCRPPAAPRGARERRRRPGGTGRRDGGRQRAWQTRVMGLAPECPHLVPRRPVPSGPCWRRRSELAATRPSGARSARSARCTTPSPILTRWSTCWRSPAPRSWRPWPGARRRVSIRATTRRRPRSVTRS